MSKGIGLTVKKPGWMFLVGVSVATSNTLFGVDIDQLTYRIILL